MKIRMTSPQGSSLEIEFSSAGMSPDGVDMRLRQVVDFYSGMIYTDFETGAAKRAPEPGEAEIEAELEPGE